MRRSIVERLAWMTWTGLLVLVAIVLAVRVHDATNEPRIERWHTFAPHELTDAELDRSDWAAYLRGEAAVMAEVRENVGAGLAAEERNELNRFAPSSRVYPPGLPRDWNRSYTLAPDGPPLGAAVLVHGLTDSPYSLRHVAERYRARGFFVVSIRLPGHGTVPAGIVATDWNDWLAATRLAVREAARHLGPRAKLHLVGYSNGAALALMYALEADGSERAPTPTRLVLISPMIGVTAYARFAGLAGLPALLPAFVKAAWLDVQPEFNPFKYNSFPVHGARETHRLTSALQSRLARTRAAAALPPVLAFQSVMDSTVSTSAVIDALFDRLPANGSEIVLFDINRAARLEPFVRRSADIALDRIVPAEPRLYTISVVTNANGAGSGALVKTRAPRATVYRSEAIDEGYPADVYSLSHVALPFPTSDSLYGRFPTRPDEYGVSLGTLAPRGEHGVLVMSIGAMLRMSSNPFFDYLARRIDSEIALDLAQ